MDGKRIVQWVSRGVRTSGQNVPKDAKFTSESFEGFITVIFISQPLTGEPQSKVKGNTYDHLSIAI